MHGHRSLEGGRLDLAPILHVPDVPDGEARRKVVEQGHGLDKALDKELIDLPPGLIRVNLFRPMSPFGT